MIYNYFKIAWRNLRRNKIFSAINILGLSLGIAVSLLIILFVVHEFSYDTFHNNAQRIFKAKGEIKYGDNIFNMEVFSAGTAAAVKDITPEVENVVRVYAKSRVLIGRTDQPQTRFYENNFLFVDPSFWDVFSFKIQAGNPSRAFTNPNQLLLTPAMAKKYFGEEDPNGKTLTFTAEGDGFSATSKEQVYEVSGIIEPAPTNSSIQYSFVVPFASLAAVEPEIYDDSKLGLGAIETYYLLNNKNAAPKVSANLEKLIPSTETMQMSFSLQEIIALHLDDSSKQIIYIFLGIALIILLLALINYMSLTTARSTIRAKEVGIRKVSGAGRFQLAR